MNRKTTLILVSVFVVLGLYTWWLQTSTKNQAVAATPTPTVPANLWSFTADQVTGLQVTDNTSGQSVVVKKDAQGQWNVVQPEARLADSSTVGSITSSLVSLSIMQNITSTTDLTPFGLAKPAFTVQADLENGTSLKAAIGDKIPTGNGYYLLRAGEATPLAVADYGLQPLLDWLKTPPYFVPTPTPAPAPSSGAPALPTATSSP
jgi:hypothetical protein